VKRVITAVILIPIVLVALFKAPLWLFTLLVFGVAALAAHEYLGIAKATGLQPLNGLCYILLAAMFVAAYIRIHTLELSPWDDVTRNWVWDPIGAAAAILFLFSPWILMAASMKRERLSSSLADAAGSFLLLPYIGITLLILLLLRESDLGAFFLLYLMLIVWAGDIAALYAGKTVGKHKLAPRVSPGKTWEGSIASCLGAVLLALALFHFSRQMFHGLAIIGLFHPGTLHVVAGDGTPGHPWLSHPPIALVVAFAICVNVAAQIGDLFESAIKRGAGVKDSGTLLPGHGGVLDRIDALLFALPVGCLFYAIMY
jgi:phosphatidate cytidylyltransferase